LQQKYKGYFLPTFDDEARTWVVDTEHGVEFGNVAYVAGEFCGNNAVYLFNNENLPYSKSPNHDHVFEGVLGSLITNPEDFSVEGFEDCYAAQELRILHNLQESLLKVKERNYPLSLEELRHNRETFDKTSADEIEVGNKKEEAFRRMEELVNSKTVTDTNIDYDRELSSYRDEK
jgi:hypothetical protein